MMGTESICMSGLIVLPVAGFGGEYLAICRQAWR